MNSKKIQKLIRAFVFSQVLHLLLRIPSQLLMKPASPWSGHHPETPEAEETSSTTSIAQSALVMARSAQNAVATSILFPGTLVCHQQPCWLPTWSQTPTTASQLRVRMECRP